LHEWARTDAVEALQRGDDYTAPVPFKLAHLPKDSDGILQPAPVHFSGPVVIIGGPRGGSHLDQFVSMFADNGLAEIVGMPTGGYSNTWKAEEILHFPGTEQPVARFMWNIGHTLRPNGEILEGNPPWPDAYIPLTRENFRNYHEMLLDAALEAVRQMPAEPRAVPQRRRSSSSSHGRTAATRCPAPTSPSPPRRASATWN